MYNRYKSERTDFSAEDERPFVRPRQSEGSSFTYLWVSIGLATAVSIAGLTTSLVSISRDTGKAGDKLADTFGTIYSKTVVETIESTICGEDVDAGEIIVGDNGHICKGGPKHSYVTLDVNKVYDKRMAIHNSVLSSDDCAVSNEYGVEIECIKDVLQICSPPADVTIATVAADDEASWTTRCEDMMIRAGENFPDIASNDTLYTHTHQWAGTEFKNCYALKCRTDPDWIGFANRTKELYEATWDKDRHHVCIGKFKNTAVYPTHVHGIKCSHIRTKTDKKYTGEECTDGQCADGFYCSDVHGDASNICAAVLHEGDECIQSTFASENKKMCFGDLQCTQSNMTTTVCLPPSPGGGDCYMSDSCVDDFTCAAGKCAKLNLSYGKECSAELGLFCSNDCVTMTEKNVFPVAKECVASKMGVNGTCVENDNCGDSLACKYESEDDVWAPITINNPSGKCK